MTALAPVAPQARPPTPQARWQIVAIGVVALLLATVFAAWYYTRPSPDTTERISYYPSAKFMADRVGCSGSFQVTATAGTSQSSGECTMADRIRVEFRVYPTGQEAEDAMHAEAPTWIDGTSGQSRAPGVGEIGGNWAVRITGTEDLAVTNGILQKLP